MTEQGWTPGQFLGAQDAPHAEFHTEANASHIRVVLKDDNLGIGAKKGSGVNQGECVGLDVFQTLLGRLNSTDEEEYVKEQERREDLKRAIYTEQKWGTIRFVHGGFLIGDKIQDLIDGEKQRVKDLKDAGSDSDSTSSDSNSDSDSEEEVKPKKEKKTIEVETANLTFDSKSKKRKSEDDGEDKAAKKARKAAEKEERKTKKSAEKEDDSKLSKKERKQKRKEHRAAKEKKRAEKAAKKEAKAAAKKDGKKDKKRNRDDSTSAVSTPSVSGTSTPRPILQSGRLAVRARNIEAKRMAAMGSASINEVCSNFSWAVN